MLMFEDRSRPHQFLTAVLWTSAVVATLVTGALAVLTALMAMSLDWGEALTAGSEPWLAALSAAGEFIGVAAAVTLGMLLWHTRRFKVPALMLIVAVTVMTAWLGGRFVLEYT